MLLIAGDRIKGDVKALTELIDRNATAAFTFGMVEVAMFQAPDKSLLLQPRLLTSTVLIERTVVIVRGLPAGVTAIEALPTADEPKEKDPAALAAHATMRAWWDPLVKAKLNDPSQEPLAYFAPNNVRAAMPWPGTWVLAYRSVSPPRLGVAFRGRSGAKMEALTLGQEAHQGCGRSGNRQVDRTLRAPPSVIQAIQAVKAPNVCLEGCIFLAHEVPFESEVCPAALKPTGPFAGGNCKRASTIFVAEAQLTHTEICNLKCIGKGAIARDFANIYFD